MKHKIACFVFTLVLITNKLNNNIKCTMYIKLNSFSSLNSVESKPNVKKQTIAIKVFLDRFSLNFDLNRNKNNETIKIHVISIT